MTRIGKSTDFGWISHEYTRARGDDKRVSAIATLIDGHLLAEGMVLDVGTGPGEIAAKLASSTRHLVGVDISPEMVRLASVALGGSAIHADAESLPFESGSFDAAVAVWVLNHVADAESVLREVYRVIRPGGRLFFLSGIPSHPEWDHMGTQLQRLDALREPRLRRERRMVPLAESLGFRASYTDEMIVDFKQRPTGLIDRIERRGFGHLRSVTTREWNDVVAPVIEDLKRFPSPDEHRKRQNRHQFAVLERPLDIDQRVELSEG